MVDGEFLDEEVVLWYKSYYSFEFFFLGVEVKSVYEDFAFGWRFVAAEDVEESCFACARGAHYADEFALLFEHVDVAESYASGFESEPHVVDLEGDLLDVGFFG